MNLATSSWFLAPAILLVVFLLATVAGWLIAPYAKRFKRMSRKFFVSALVLLFAGAISKLAFEAVASHPNWLGPATKNLAGIAFIGLAAGGITLAGAIGFLIAGRLARALGNTPRLGRPGVVIAIDGPAASGKGTLAKRIAEYYRVPVLDTGLLYRAVARDVMLRGGALTDTITAIACANALKPRSFNDPELRGERAGEAASVVARIPEVRAALLSYQRNFAKAKSGAVLDGRDIGTVVCPNADVKIYITATPEERARRRHKELAGRGEQVSFEEVLEDIHRRDARDTGRAIAPLWPAADAAQLDTTGLDADQAFAAALKIIESRLQAA